MTQIFTVFQPLYNGEGLCVKDSSYFSPLALHKTPNDAIEHIRKGPSRQNSWFV